MSQSEKVKKRLEALEETPEQKAKREARNKAKAKLRYLRSDSWRIPKLELAYRAASNYIRIYANGTITDVTKSKVNWRSLGKLTVYGTTKGVLNLVPNKINDVKVVKILVVE